MHLADWFLTVAERQNDATRIDDRREHHDAWTEGNSVRVLIDGAQYFALLYESLCSLRRDDWVHFTDWEGDPDERLVGPGTELGAVLVRPRPALGARARPALAIAPEAGALLGAGQRRARPRRSTPRAVRSCSTSGYGAVGATTRSCSSSGAPAVPTTTLPLPAGSTSVTVATTTTAISEIRRQ